MRTQSSLGIAPPARHWRTPPARTVGFGLLALMALLVVLQFIPYGRNHSNPPVLAEPAWNSAQTRALFFRACGDCHSNQTTWPWYSSFAPVSWLVQHDVQDGREDFNVSEWGRARNKADEAAKTVQRNRMPPWFYITLHPSARLSPGERQELIAGLIATFGNEEGDEENEAGE